MWRPFCNLRRRNASSTTGLTATEPADDGEEDTMSQDPVCGMQLTEASAVARAEYKGKTYYFCSPACKKMFDQHPEKYASK